MFGIWGLVIKLVRFYKVLKIFLKVVNLIILSFLWVKLII